MPGTLPKIVLLSLGGTIASRVDARGRGAALTFDASDLLATLPMLAEIADVIPHPFRMEMSSNLTLGDITALAVEIAQRAKDGVDGVVVTQGTDTIEETAYLLDLLVSPGIPVVVTGAMRNPGKPGEDGPANLVGAIRVAAHSEARDCGVLVMLDDTIQLARFVHKTHTSATGAFSSPSVGPVGYLVEDRVRMPLKPRRMSPHFDLRPDVPLPEVGLLTLSLGNDERLIRSVAAAGYRGLVVETFGAGHVAVRTVEAVAELAKQMPVVFASRTGAGELYQYLGHYPGSEGDLLARGLIGAVGLDGLKARLLLILLLATGASHDAMAAAFEAAST
jgi:L-asparaginase